MPTPKDYFWLHKIVLKIGGISFERRDHISYTIYSVIAVCFCVLMVLQEMIMIIYTRNSDMIAVATVISLGATHLLGFVRIVVLMKKRLLIADSLETLQNGIYLPNIKRGGIIEEDIIKNCISTTYKHAAGYYIPAIITLLVGGVMGLISKFTEEPEEWKQPWISFVLFDISTSFRYYCVYFCQCMGLITFACNIITCDLLIIATCVHIIGQFGILENLIKTMAPNDLDVSKISKTDFQTRIKEVVVYHQGLIDLADKLEDSFNIVTLAVFLGNIMVLCFTMYLSTLNSLGGLRIFREGSYFLLIIIQIYLYSYYGNELMLCGQTISFACYEVNFIGTDLSFQKDLVLIMRRSQKPLLLTVGKFTNLNLSTFLAIIRASYSCLMVITNGNA